jgi:hypothetical protein
VQAITGLSVKINGRKWGTKNYRKAIERKSVRVRSEDRKQQKISA